LRTCVKNLRICAAVVPPSPHASHTDIVPRGEKCGAKKIEHAYKKKNTAVVPPRPHASHTDIVPEGGDHTMDAPVGEQS